MSPLLKIFDIDTGFCRITYATRNAEGERIYYCPQDEGERFGGVRLYRCTDEGEPSHEVSFKRPAAEIFEVPTGSSKLELLCKEWIEKH